MTKKVVDINDYREKVVPSTETKEISKEKIRGILDSLDRVNILLKELKRRSEEEEK